MVKARKKRRKFKKTKSPSTNPAQYKEMDARDSKKFFTVALIVTAIALVLVYLWVR